MRAYKTQVEVEQPPLKGSTMFLTEPRIILEMTREEAWDLVCNELSLAELKEVLNRHE